MNNHAPRSAELVVCGVFLGLASTLYNLDFLVTLLALKSSPSSILVQSVFVAANSCAFFLLFLHRSPHGRICLLCTLSGLAGFSLLETAQLCSPLPGTLGHVPLARLITYTAIVAIVGLSKTVPTSAGRRLRLAVYSCLAGTVLLPVIATMGFRGSLQRISPVVTLLRPNEWLGKPVPSVLLQQLAQTGTEIQEYLVLADLDTVRGHAFVARVCGKSESKPIVVIWIGDHSQGLENCKGLKLSRFNTNVQWVFEPLVVLRIRNGLVDQVEVSGEMPFHLVSSPGAS